MDKFSKDVQDLAAKMAVAINGNSWDNHYNESQKVGWCLKIQWALDNLK